MCHGAQVIGQLVASSWFSSTTWVLGIKLSSLVSVSLPTEPHNHLPPPLFFFNISFETVSPVLLRLASILWLSWVSQPSILSRNAGTGNTQLDWMLTRGFLKPCLALLVLKPQRSGILLFSFNVVFFEITLTKSLLSLPTTDLEDSWFISWLVLCRQIFLSKTVGSHHPQPNSHLKKTKLRPRM